MITPSASAFWPRRSGSWRPRRLGADASRRSAYSYVREASGEVTVDLRPERHGRGPAQPADLRRRRGPHRRSGPRRDRARRWQRPARGRRHVGPVRVALRASRAPTTTVSAISLQEGSILLSVVGSDDGRRAPHRHGRRHGLHEPGLARARQRGSAARLGRRRARRLGRGAHARPAPTPCAPATTCSRTARRSPRSRAAASRATASTSGRPIASQATYDAPQQRVEPVRRRGLRRRRRRRSTATATGTTTRTTRRYVWRPNVDAGLDALLERLLVLHARRPDLVVLGSVGLVSLPLRQLVLRHGLEQLVLVARLRLLAGVGLLGLHALLRRLVPDRLVRLLLALVEQLLPPLGVSRGAASRFAINGNVLDAPRGHARLELHRRERLRHDARPHGRHPGHARRGSSRRPARDFLAPDRRRRARRASASASRCATTSATRPRASSAPPVRDCRSGSSPSSPATASCRARRVDALRDRAVVADRGRLSGPGAADVAPRGATVVDRGGAAAAPPRATRIETDRATGRTVLRDGGGAAAESSPGTRGHGAPAATRGPKRRRRGVPAARSNPAAARRLAPRPTPTSRGRENREHWRTRTRRARPRPTPQASTRNLESDRGGRAPAPDRGRAGLALARHLGAAGPARHRGRGARPPHSRRRQRARASSRATSSARPAATTRRRRGPTTHRRRPREATRRRRRARRRVRPRRARPLRRARPPRPRTPRRRRRRAPLASGGGGAPAARKIAESPIDPPLRGFLLFTPRPRARSFFETIAARDCLPIGPAATGPACAGALVSLLANAALRLLLHDGRGLPPAASVDRAGAAARDCSARGSSAASCPASASSTSRPASPTCAI